MVSLFLNTTCLSCNQYYVSLEKKKYAGIQSILNVNTIMSNFDVDSKKFDVEKPKNTSTSKRRFNFVISTFDVESTLKLQ